MKKIKLNRMKMLIVGIGNEFRTDDSIGIILAREIKKKFEYLDVIENSGDGADLIERWTGYDVVIIIDAVDSGDTTGDLIFIEPKSAAFADYQPIASSHLFGVRQAIQTSEVLNRLPPNLIIIGITGKKFETGNSLSKEMACSYQKVLNKIEDHIKKFI